jgi:hypothetical protein
MDFFRHDLALTQKSTFDFRIRATKPNTIGLTQLKLSTLSVTHKIVCDTQSDVCNPSSVREV